jgi:hypothetical protein
LIPIVILWASRAGAQEEEDAPRWQPPEDTRPHNGASVSLGTMFMSPSLGDAVFTGNGTPLTGGTSGFRHTAREMGVAKPSLFGGEMRVAYVRKYFEIGLQGYMGGGYGDRDAGALTVRPLVDPSNVSFIGGGGHAIAVIPLGSFAFTFGPDVGGRVFDVPITGFQRYECQTKAGKQQCTQQATTAQFYVTPRVGVLLNTGDIGRKLSEAGIFLHAWVGGDVVPASSLAFGISIGGAFNHNAMGGP